MNDVYSFGNTVMNLFSGWDEDNFYHFYIRKQAPRNDFIKEYFNISSRDAVKSVLKRKRGGRRFTSSDFETVREKWGKEEAEEKRLIDSTRKEKRPFLYFLEESFWSTGIWQNKKFKEFIKDADPDVFFAFATNSYILYPLIKYLKKHTRARIVLFIADDMISGYGKRGVFSRRRLISKLQKCLASADKLYGISEKMCRHYSVMCGKHVEFLCKGCDFSLPVRGSKEYPLKLVYAGNVLYGRDSTLEKIADAIAQINAERRMAELEIYTTTKLDGETLDRLNIEGSSKVFGGIPYEELLKLQNRADILLHVESFEKDASERVRYSFSTKITDCLQSGASLVAVGPADIASMEFLAKTDGVTVITDPSEIKNVLLELISDIEALNEKKKRIREYSEAYLSGSEINLKLREEFAELIRR